MFATDNSTFTAGECVIRNDAADKLRSEYRFRSDYRVPDAVAAEIEKTINDQIDSAWVEGITAAELVAKIQSARIKDFDKRSRSMEPWRVACPACHARGYNEASDWTDVEDECDISDCVTCGGNGFVGYEPAPY